MTRSQPTPAWQAARNARRERRNQGHRRYYGDADDLAVLDSQIARLMRSPSYVRPLPPVLSLHQLARRRADRTAA